MNNVIAKKILTISLLFVMACGEEKTATSKEKTAVVPKTEKVEAEKKPIEDRILEEAFLKVEQCIQEFDPDWENVKRNELEEEKIALYKSVLNDCEKDHLTSYINKLDKIAKAYNITRRKLIDKYLEKHPELKEKYFID